MSIPTLQEIIPFTQKSYYPYLDKIHSSGVFNQLMVHIFSFKVRINNKYSIVSGFKEF